MTVSGKYKDKFSEASHVCFEGHLDDPFFRAVAIQRIESLGQKTVILSTSGESRIIRRKGRESVNITYRGFFGEEKTKGHPFKDNDSNVCELKKGG